MFAEKVLIVRKDCLDAISILKMLHVGDECSVCWCNSCSDCR